MPNLRLFGSPIHDTALVMIVTSSLASIVFSFFGEIGRSEANISILAGGVTAFLYWFTQYRVKK